MSDILYRDRKRRKVRMLSVMDQAKRKEVSKKRNSEEQKIRSKKIEDRILVFSNQYRLQKTNIGL